MILHIFITMLIYSCGLDGNMFTYLPLHNGMASVKKTNLEPTFHSQNVTQFYSSGNATVLMKGSLDLVNTLRRIT